MSQTTDKFDVAASRKYKTNTANTVVKKTEIIGDGGVLILGSNNNALTKNKHQIHGVISKQNVIMNQISNGQYVKPLEHRKQSECHANQNVGGFRSTVNTSSKRAKTASKTSGK